MVPGREKRTKVPGKGALSDFAAALGFLTILPVPTGLWDAPTERGRAFSWFPLVGLGLGLLTAAVGGALDLVFPAGVCAALTVALGVFLTGGLHLDGLMDSCDGLFCAKPPEERLQVMRDSRVGAFGALGAISVLLVKYAALSALFELPRATLLVSLVLAPVLGRWAMALAVFAFPYYRHGESLGASFVAGAGVRQLVLASATGLAVVITLVLLDRSVAPLAALVCAALATLAVAAFTLSRMPGLTGDVYGAVGETAEVAVLLALVGWFA